MASLISTLINLYILIVVIRVLMSWFEVDPNNQVIRFMHDITEPILSKIRGIIPAFGGLDLSPLVLILALSILRNILFPGY